MEDSSHHTKGYNLRLLQTFAGVLQKKKFKNLRTHAVFTETATNYISVERL